MLLPPDSVLTCIHLSNTAWGLVKWHRGKTLVDEGSVKGETAVAAGRDVNIDAVLRKRAQWKAASSARERWFCERRFARVISQFLTRLGIIRANSTRSLTSRDLPKKPPRRIGSCQSTCLVSIVCCAGGAHRWYFFAFVYECRCRYSDVDKPSSNEVTFGKYQETTRETAVP